MGLYYWFAPFTPSATPFSAMLLQPVVIAVLSALLGNTDCDIIGAGMSFIWRDLNAGRQRAVDPALADCISIPIAVKAGMDPNPRSRWQNPVWRDWRVSRSA